MNVCVAYVCVCGKGAVVLCSVWCANQAVNTKDGWQITQEYDLKAVGKSVEGAETTYQGTKCQRGFGAENRRWRKR